MNTTEWQRLVAALRNIDDVEGALAAASGLQTTASAEDLPRLLELLKDESFFVREAAAWALSDMERLDVLPALLAAYQRGFEEGLDNDGFSAALADLVSANPEEARSRLEAIAKDSSHPTQTHARWLLEFCE